METLDQTTDTPQPRRSFTQRLLHHLPPIRRALADAHYAGMLEGARIALPIADALRNQAGAR